MNTFLLPLRQKPLWRLNTSGFLVTTSASPWLTQLVRNQSIAEAVKKRPFEKSSIAVEKESM
jgi:hypothetical protein